MKREHWFELYVDEERAPREPSVIRPHADAVRRMNDRGGWATVRDAAQWVTGRGAPIAWFRVTQYEPGEDGDERIGGCALDEAESFGYEDLNF